MPAIKSIHGEKFIDGRGELRFFNNFNMDEIVRFYEIAPIDTKTVRAWQGHQEEKKWLYCTKGAFVVNLVRFSDPIPSQKPVRPEKFLLKAETPMVLEIGPGLANGFKAIKENSRLLVFSNFTLEESKKDDFRFPLEKWEFAI